MPAGRDALSTMLAVLQLADGLFPAGGFAHSLGLETYAQDGRVADRAGLEAFLAAQLEGALGPADAVAVGAAARWAGEGALTPVLALDRELDAMRWVPELSAASRQMGRQTARVAAALGESPLLVDLEGAIEAGRTPGHHAVAFGAACGVAGASAETSAAAFLHSSCAMLVGAALRLLPLGQLEGQQALAAMRPRIARLARRAAATETEHLWGFAPGLELAALRHATLDMRLFRS
jgi:urease accessory protein